MLHHVFLANGSDLLLYIYARCGACIAAGRAGNHHNTVFHHAKSVRSFARWSRAVLPVHTDSSVRQKPRSLRRAKLVCTVQDASA
jgi:hypothetical protein